MSINLHDSGYTGAQANITLEHWAIHAGLTFMLSNVITVPAANESEFWFRTPAVGNGELHMLFNFECDAVFTVTVFETTTKTYVAGNILTPYNRDRNSSNTSNAFICLTPGGSGDGTQLSKHASGLAGNAIHGAGGNVSVTGELVLKAATDYLINVACAQNDILSYDFDWIEVPK